MPTPDNEATLSAFAEGAATPEPSAPASVRALERAEQDLSMYAATLGRRPTVAPESAEADDDKRFAVSLHLNLPGRMPSLPSLQIWRHKTDEQSSRQQMLKLLSPSDSAPRLKMSGWLRQFSTKARKCVDEVWMRLAS